MDNDSSTTDIASYEWEVALITKARGEVPADDGSSDEEEAEELADPTPVLTTREALVCATELVTFAMWASDPPMLEAVAKVQNLVQNHCIKQAAVAKQKSIRDVFSAQ